MHPRSDNPRIVRLTSLDEALKRLLPLASPALPRRRASVEASGAVLAEDVRAEADVPAGRIARRDGWAVNAEELVGATPYSAAILAPPPGWVDAGDAMPDATDAILPPDAVTIAAPGMAEVSASVSPGEGVLDAGADVAAGGGLLDAGTRLQSRHLALLAACGIPEVPVRAPRIRLVHAGAASAGCVDLVRRWLEDAGGDVADTIEAQGDRKALADAYRSPGADLIVSVGGTGQGRFDCAVAALADAEGLAAHGVAMAPGGDAAFGRTGGGIVVLLPGRLDAMVGAFLLLVRPTLAVLSGAEGGDDAVALSVSQKVVSTIGVAELFLALRGPEGIRPLALEDAGFADFARAVGWFVVAPAQEGFAAGQTVQVRSFSPR